MQLNQYMPRQSAFSLLFSRYINGDITERAWAKLMHTFDKEGLSATERMAYARFMSEMIDESGNGRLNVPSSKEVKDILADLRAKSN